MTRRSMIAVRAADADDARFLADMLLAAVNWHPERRVPMAQVMADPNSRTTSLVGLAQGTVESSQWRT